MSAAIASADARVHPATASKRRERTDDASSEQAASTRGDRRPGLLPKLLIGGAALAAGGAALLTLRNSSSRPLRIGAAAVLALGGAALLGACGSTGSPDPGPSYDQQLEAARERLRQQVEEAARQQQNYRTGAGNTGAGAGGTAVGGTSVPASGNAPIGGTGPASTESFPLTPDQAAQMLAGGNSAVMGIGNRGVKYSAALTLNEGRRQTLTREYEWKRGYDTDGNGRIGSDYTLRPGLESTYSQGARVYVGPAGQEVARDFTSVQAAMQFMTSNGVTAFRRL